MRLRVLDESVNFSCGSCTSCCDQPWGTLIEVDKAHALDAHDFSARPQLAGKSLYHKSKGIPDGFYVLAKGEGTRCVFLDTDGLCVIHKEMGPEAKPGPCLKFPYVVAHTTVDDRVSVDFGCPAVQANRGRPLVEQTDDVAATVELGQRPVDADATIALDSSHRLTSAEADALFDRLMPLFGDDQPGDLWSRFAAALALLAAASHFKTAAPASDHAEGQTLVELLRSGAEFPNLPAVPEVTAYDSPAAASSPARLLFAATLFRDTVPLDATMSMGFWKRLTLMPKLMSLAKLTGVYASRLLGRNVPVRDVMTYPVASELDPGATRLLLRYYRSRLWQRYLAGTRLSIMGGVHQHIQDLNAIVFLARAEAFHSGASKLTEAMIRQALTRVEFHLANQPRVFDQNMIGWFRSQLESPAVAFQSLRLMSLKSAVGGLERVRVESRE